jgi:hypothetical protein
MVKPPGSHYTVVLSSCTSIFPLPGAVIQSPSLVILSEAKNPRSSLRINSAKDLSSASQVARKKNYCRDPSLRSG